MSVAEEHVIAVAEQQGIGEVRGAHPEYLAKKIAKVAFAAGGRNLIITGLSALATAVVARQLGAGPFGAYVSALATAQLAISFGDLGFSLVLGRDLAPDVAGRGLLLRTVVQVQFAWTLVLTVGVLIMGLLAGVGSARGDTLLIVAPAVAASSLAATRQLYNATFRIRLLVIVDLAVNLTQIAITIGLALLHAPPPALAAVFTLSLTTNSVLIAIAAFRSTPARRPRLADHWAIVRRAVPVGVASVLSSVYFTIDMVIIPWLVGGPSVGRYGAACKVLAVLVTIPGLVVGAALPGLSLAGADRAHFSELMARVEQWLATIALPLCGFIVVFAGPIMTLLFGSAYRDAAPLLRILAGAAAAASLGNVFGTALVSKSLVRPQVACNAVAMVLNIGANIALVPHFGVAAAAWLTLATELFVMGWACIVLRHVVDLRLVASRLGRPALATAVLMSLGLGLQSTLPVAVPLAVLGFVAALTALRGWPDEFRVWRLRSHVSAGAQG